MLKDVMKIVKLKLFIGEWTQQVDSKLVVRATFGETSKMKTFICGECFKTEYPKLYNTYEELSRARFSAELKAFSQEWLEGLDGKGVGKDCSVCAYL